MDNKANNVQDIQIKQQIEEAIRVAKELERRSQYSIHSQYSNEFLDSKDYMEEIDYARKLKDKYMKNYEERLEFYREQRFKEREQHIADSFYDKHKWLNKIETNTYTMSYEKDDIYTDGNDNYTMIHSRHQNIIQMNYDENDYFNYKKRVLDFDKQQRLIQEELRKKSEEEERLRVSIIKYKEALGISNSNEDVGLQALEKKIKEEQEEKRFFQLHLKNEREKIGDYEDLSNTKDYIDRYAQASIDRELYEQTSEKRRLDYLEKKRLEYEEISKREQQEKDKFLEDKKIKELLELRVMIDDRVQKEEIDRKIREKVLSMEKRELNELNYRESLEAKMIYEKELKRELSDYVISGKKLEDFQSPNEEKLSFVNDNIKQREEKMELTIENRRTRDLNERGAVLPISGSKVYMMEFDKESYQEPKESYKEHLKSEAEKVQDPKEEKEKQEKKLEEINEKKYNNKHDLKNLKNDLNSDGKSEEERRKIEEEIKRLEAELETLKQEEKKCITRLEVSQIAEFQKTQTQSKYQNKEYVLER